MVRKFRRKAADATAKRKEIFTPQVRTGRGSFEKESLVGRGIWIVESARFRSRSFARNSPAQASGILRRNKREWRCLMASANPTPGVHVAAQFVKKMSGWYIAMAVLFIILGIFAIVEPGVAGLAGTVVVGWLLIFGGAAHLVSAFSGGGAGRVIWQVLIGIVFMAGGCFFFLSSFLGFVGVAVALSGDIFF